MDKTPLTQTIDCTQASIEELRHAFAKRLPIAGITCFLYHHGPHGDEITSGFVITTTPEGEYSFPGTKNASIGFTTNTSLRNNGFLGDEGFFKALQKGYLLLGIGGGPFDEHRNRANRQSCSNLVRMYIDLYKNSENREIYGPLLRYIN